MSFSRSSRVRCRWLGSRRGIGPTDATVGNANGVRLRGLDGGRQSAGPYNPYFAISSRVRPFVSSPSSATLMAPTSSTAENIRKIGS